MKFPEITVQALDKMRKANEDIFILDVRNPDEYKAGNLGGYLIPLNELPKRFNELDPQKRIVVHCHAGVRSTEATNFLVSKGFKHVYNLKGGIAAWANEIDPKVLKK